MSSEKYSGSQWIETAKGIRRDILTVILQPDKLYTDKEVAVLIKKFETKEASTNGRR